MSVAAIVPVAGAGQRFGRRGGKACVALHGRPMLAHTLRALQQSRAVRWIVPVVRPGDARRIQAMIRRERITKALPVQPGGASRSASVANGLAALPSAARWVLIHDGARPCVTPRLITQCVLAVKRHGAVACGLPASVTVKAVDEARGVRVTLDREQLWFVQTPQVFRRDWYVQALARANGQLGEFPDDAAMLEAAGFAVRMVPGESLNLKVTTADDLVMAEAVLHRRHGARR